MLSTCFISFNEEKFLGSQRPSLVRPHRYNQDVQIPSFLISVNWLSLYHNCWEIGKLNVLDEKSIALLLPLNYQSKKAFNEIIVAA